MRTRGAVLFGLTILGVLGVACDPIADVTFSNPNRFQVEIFGSQDPDAPRRTVVEPGQTKTVGFAKRVWPGRLVGKDPSGRIIFDKKITWAEAKDGITIILQ
jgi:hypothetical protein